jgi:uncharacterized protein (DUF305 family)
MEKNNKAIIVGLITLIIGLGIGYCVGANRGDNRYAEIRNNTSMMGRHMMPNGQMMSNGGETNTTSNSSMSMQDMMTSMNANLQGKTGDIFDQAFLSEMIVHHQGAVAMAQQALTNAKHQEIKDLAKGIISAQNKEIAEMQQWQKTWYSK